MLGRKLGDEIHVGLCLLYLWWFTGASWWWFLGFLAVGTAVNLLVRRYHDTAIKKIVAEFQKRPRGRTPL